MEQSQNTNPCFVAFSKDSLAISTDTVATHLAQRTDELVERHLAAMRAHRGYDCLPEDDLRRSCHRNVVRVLAILGRTDLLGEVDEDERASGQRRALPGVPSNTVVEAYRAVLAVLRDAFIEEAVATGADTATALAGTTRLWDLTDEFSSVLFSARQQVEIDAACRDERHRIASYSDSSSAGWIPPNCGPAGTSAGSTGPSPTRWSATARRTGLVDTGRAPDGLPGLPPADPRRRHLINLFGEDAVPTMPNDGSHDEGRRYFPPRPRATASPCSPTPHGEMTVPDDLESAIAESAGWPVASRTRCPHRTADATPPPSTWST